MIAGLEDITAGEVRVSGKVVNGLPPKARDMAMIFQNYALYPHMNVFENMAFGLKMRGIAKGEIRRRVDDAAKILGLSEVLGKRPRHLSGGQRQRVAMGRAIVREPVAFLMDEPLSNLDAKLRVQMRAEIARIQRDLRVTTIYVTHDQSEAMTLGDRVCVLRGGLLQQVDRPQVLYDRPANLFVAGFIGSPAMNLVESQLVSDGGAVTARFGPHELAIPDEILAGRPSLRGYVGGGVALGIRPEDLEDVRAPEDSRLDVTVDIKRTWAPRSSSTSPSTRHPWIPRSCGTCSATRRWRPRTSRREPVQLAVNTQLLHFFDLQTGAGIY